MRFLRNTAVIVLPAIASACIAGPTTAPAPRDYVIHAPADRVWSALIETVTDLNMPIGTLDKGSWFFRTPSVYNAGDYLDCGTAMGARVQALHWTIEAEMTAMLRPMGDSTMMKVNLAGRAFNPDNPSAHRTTCVGLGTLESDLVTGVQQHLAPGGK